MSIVVYCHLFYCLLGTPIFNHMVYRVIAWPMVSCLNYPLTCYILVCGMDLHLCKIEGRFQANLDLGLCHSSILHTPPLDLN